MAQGSVKSIKISQISKDLNLKTKDVLDTFSNEVGIEKKSGATVDIAEFELFMQKLTLAHQIKNIDAYLSGETKITIKKEAQPELKAEAKPKTEAKAKAESKTEAKPEVKAEPKVVKEYAPAAEGSIEAQIETFLAGLLKHMGSEAVPHAYKVDEETYRADLVGGDAGLLIGRRGDTLDAIQYLTGYAINREREKRLRINVDAGEYRLKREESLQQLAKKMAAKAVKYRRNFTLEPMNAYERHVIHSALQEYPEVTTFSTGSEPHRRIVVAYAKEK